MQTQPSAPKPKKNILVFVIAIPAGLILIGIFWLVISLIFSSVYKSPETQEVRTPPPLPKRKAYHVNIYVQSNVDGAEVYLTGESESGERVEKKDVTKSTDFKASFFKIRPGKYEIRMTKAGYEEAVKQVGITGERFTENIKMELSK